jgi:hypothetical protein
VREDVVRRLAALIALSAGCALVVGGVAGADTTTSTSEPTTTTTTTTAPALDCGVAAVGGTIDCDLGGLPPTEAVVKAVNGTDSDVRVTTRKGDVHVHIAVDSATSGTLDHAVAVPLQCGANTLTATVAETTSNGTFTLDCSAQPAAPATATTSPNSAASSSNGRIKAGPLMTASAPAGAVATPRAAKSAAAPAAAGCDPSYPDFCIPSGQPDLDCDQVGRANFTVKPPDPYGFDEGDGIGCVDDSLGKDAVVPPDNSTPGAVTPGATTPSAPHVAAPVTTPANTAAATQSASTDPSLAKTGLAVARQAMTAGLLIAIGLLFVSWSRRSASGQFL